MGYDISTGIYDHENPTVSRPLAAEAAHPAESYSENSGIFHAMARYERQGIKDKFGLSLTEYLHLPRDYIEKLSNLLIQIGTRRKKAAAAAEAEAAKGQGKL